MAIIYGNAISIGYATSGSSVGGTYSIWLTLPAVAASTTFTAVKDGVSVASTYISSIKAAKITLPADNPEGDWIITGIVSGKTVSKTVTVKSGTVDYFVDFRNDFIPLVGDLAVGNLVTFDNKEWRVVHQEGSHWYLALSAITENVVFGNNSIYKNSTLADKCTSWMNENLSATALEYCDNVLVENVNNKVFIPTYAQINSGFSYYNSSTNRICQNNGINTTWWTSSSYSSSVSTRSYYVDTDGTFSDGGVTYTNGFRPHIMINVNNSGLDFTYTGDYRIRFEDGVVELLSSGTIMFPEPKVIDVFMVGGGGAGGSAVVGSSGQSVGGTGGTTSFGNLSVLGGNGGGGVNSRNLAGGSGGGSASYSSTAVNSSFASTKGGVDGNDGTPNSTGTYKALGQGTTTREFGEPTGKLYAGGGGGAGSQGAFVSNYKEGSAGGNGGGGAGGSVISNVSHAGTSGTPNTGGGGGGGAGRSSSSVAVGGGGGCGGYTKTEKQLTVSANTEIVVTIGAGGIPNGSSTLGGSGGSGIVCIRLHKEASPTTIPLTGDLAVGNTVTFDDKSFVVVHNEGTQWYLAKEYITDQTTFSSKTPALYNGSKVASMCNTYLTQFSDNAKKYMVDVTVEGVTNKVFVPTHAQVNGGFSWYNSNANRTVKRDTDKVTMSWWTSTSYNNSNLLYAIEGGQSSSTGSILTKTYDHTLGVRPHICIDTSLSGSASEETVLNGTYLFNANPTAPAKYPFTETVPYKYGSSSGGIYQSIRFYQDTNTKNLCMYYHYSDTTATAVYNFTTKKWLNDTYKTIIFDNQTVSESFYNWIIANTTLSS